MSLRSIALAALLMSGMALSASADPIPLVNPGFELPGTGKIAGGFDMAANDIPGWSNTGTVYNDSGVESSGGTWIAFLRGGDDGIFQTTSHTAAANQRLTLDYKARSTWQATDVTAGLFYLDASGQRQNLQTGIANVTGNPDTSPFANFTLNYDIPVDSPANGRPVGVFFDNTTTAAGTWAGIDDVALTVTLVPEPGSVALISLLSLPLLRRRRK